MFREMRRKKQQLSEKETLEILNRGTSGVLALHGDDGYPYAVPISYVYSGSKLYFHSAKAGHKIDAIKNSEKASFCVIDRDDVVPEEYTTYFRSAIAFGKLRILEQNEEIIHAISALGRKYHPNGSEEELKNAIMRELNPLCVFEMEIDHLTGKEAIELVRARE